MIRIENQIPADARSVENLLDAAFGPDRKSKSAYALRHGVNAVAELSFKAVSALGLVGCIHFWPLAMETGENGSRPQGLLLLGPLAVDPEKHGLGIGQALVDHGLMAARDLGFSAAVLVGDPGYYGRFGFAREPVSGLDLPGEADQSRVLGHEIEPGSLTGLKGTIVAAVM